MIEIKKIYKANNGDVFLLKETDYKQHTKEEIEDLIKKAKEMYSNNEYEKCIYREGTVSKFGSYYDKNGNFLGNEQIHILSEFSYSQDGIYLKYKGELNSIWENKVVEKIMNDTQKRI